MLKITCWVKDKMTVLKLLIKTPSMHKAVAIRLQAGGQWDGIFKVLKEKKIPMKSSIPSMTLINWLCQHECSTKLDLHSSGYCWRDLPKTEETPWVWVACSLNRVKGKQRRLPSVLSQELQFSLSLWTLSLTSSADFLSPAQIFQLSST